jgi:hypothetical protein
MLWIPVEEREPPLGTWIYLTRNPGDDEYTATQKLCFRPGSEYEGSLEFCRDIGYTHWKYKDEALQRYWASYDSVSPGVRR